jgi:signal peptidase
MDILHRINIAISVVVFTVCCGVFLLFGWSGSGWKALTVPTGSMRPTITPGSLVLVHRVPIASLKVGDVITYINPLDPKTTLSHRIIKKIMIDGTVPGFITKGDANKLPDVPFAAGAVEGQVVWHVPHVGNLLLDGKKPIVTLPIVYFAALLIMIEEVERLADYYKSRVPYRLAGYELHIVPKRSFAKLYTVACLFLGAVGVLAYFGPEAIAAQNSNVVALTENRITVVGAHKPPPCTCKTTTTTTNNTSVTVTNTTDQNATSGNSQSSNGNSASGTATNTNGTNVNTNIDNTTTNGP